jgi:hypothetical protein
VNQYPEVLAWRAVIDRPENIDRLTVELRVDGIETYQQMVRLLEPKLKEAVGITCNFRQLDRLEGDEGSFGGCIDERTFQ